MISTCLLCKKFDVDELGAYCRTYRDTSWVVRRGGCPIPHRAEIMSAAKIRVGQQKQKRRKR